MQQFIVIAYDATDADAPKRRADAREAHLAQIAKMRAGGNALFGAAITNDAGTMVGSVIAAAFPTRKELDAWLAIEPYVKHKVWDRITVHTSKLAPAFSDLLSTKAS